MVMKRVFALILTLTLLVFSAFSVSAETNVLSFGRIAVKMPEITVELKGGGYKNKDITATLESEKLTVIETKKYNPQKDSTRTYILVDLSTSMAGYFDLVKQSITTYINESADKNKVVLITFGKERVETILTGNENKQTAIKKVNSLNCNEGGTLFYEALSKAYQMSSESSGNFDREYVIAFSDGIDLQKGSTTFNEVKEQYDSRALPIYAACSYKVSQDAADKFGELARISGGEFSIISDQKIFDSFLQSINNVTLIKLRAASNFADGKERQLTLKVGDKQIEYNVPIIRSISDDKAPEIEKIYFDGEKQAFMIAFSEKVTGADSANAYKITDSNGNKIAISDVFYSEKNDIYEIKTKDTVYNGTYTVEFSGIKDASKEANVLSEKKVVDVDTADSDMGILFWILIIAVAVVVLGGGVVLIIILTTRKKAPEEHNQESAILNKKPAEIVDYMPPAPEQFKHHIKLNDTARIRLRIRTGNTSEQNIETNISSSIIIGRSDTCDIYIDDTKLSRQHFVIENDNGNFYVMDLQSRNGTMLNGIKINSRQPLNNGDKILAGLSDIVITIIR